MAEIRKLNLKTICIASGLLLVVLVIVLALGTGVFAGSKERILQGVSIKGVNFSNLTREQAAAKLASMQGAIEKKEIEIICQKNHKRVTLKELEFRIDVARTFKKAVYLGRHGSLWARWREREKLSAKGINIAPIYSYSEEKIKKITDDLAGQMQIKAEDARFIINKNDKVEIKPERIGKKVDLKDVINKITEIASDIRGPEAELEFENIKPRTTAHDLEAMGIKGLMSSYVTYFDSKNVNRTYNVNVAADAFNELLVKPGDEVSFNKIVGPRDASAGYKEAPIIVNDEVVDGLGGGVCQVSSTLYNTVLLADLEIIERTNHSIPVGYVPLGRDATVNFGSLDFKFKNNTEHYLLIKSEVKDNAVTFKIYGTPLGNKEIKIETLLQKVLEPQVIYEDDLWLEAGKEIIKQEGKKGFEVRSYRQVFENGKEVRKEELPVSVYHPQNRVIAVGKKYYTNTIIPLPDTGE